MHYLLGPEFGGAIGLMFVLAQSMAIAMHLIGFCESLLDMLIQVYSISLYVRNHFVLFFYFTYFFNWNHSVFCSLISIGSRLDQCFSTGGSQALTFGSPKPVLYPTISTYGLPNCVLFCFVGRQQSNVENHWSRDKLSVWRLSPWI